MQLQLSYGLPSVDNLHISIEMKKANISTCITKDQFYVLQTATPTATSGAQGPSTFNFITDMFQPVLHDWCNKGRGMYYPVCGMMHINEPLLLTGMSSYVSGPLPYVWSHMTVNKMCWVRR